VLLAAVSPVAAEELISLAVGISIDVEDTSIFAVVSGVSDDDTLPSCVDVFSSTSVVVLSSSVPVGELLADDISVRRELISSEVISPVVLTVDDKSEVSSDVVDAGPVCDVDDVLSVL
jgi:hypothetical protein